MEQPYIVKTDAEGNATLYGPCNYHAFFRDFQPEARANKQADQMNHAYSAGFRDAHAG